MNIRSWSYILLLVILSLSLIANLYFFTQLNNTDEGIAVLENDKQVVKEECELLKRDLDLATANIKALKHPANQAFQLTGSSPDFTNASATIFWNSTTKAVYVDAAALPPQPGDKEYQLWAVNKGVYKSLGVFNRQPDKEILYRAINTEKPDAFAVSLELPPGSETPTLLCASGKTGN